MSATLSTTTTNDKVVQIDWVNKDGTVTITPRDQDRFNMRVHRVIEACTAAVERDRAEQRFDFLLKQIAKWLTGKKEVRDAYVTMQDGRILFLAVLRSAAYSREFEDALTNLHFQIIDDPELEGMRMDVMSLPAVGIEALRAFLDPTVTIKLEGQDGN